jgi:hypothetical protein
MGVLATIPRASANYHFHLGTGEIRTAQANPRQKKKRSNPGGTRESQQHCIVFMFYFAFSSCAWISIGGVLGTELGHLEHCFFSQTVCHQHQRKGSLGRRQQLRSTIIGGKPENRLGAIYNLLRTGTSARSIGVGGISSHQSTRPGTSTRG